MQRLTLKEALPIVRKAFEERTLGAFTYSGCQYDYGDDHRDIRCAIGMCLSKETLQDVKINSCNYDTLNDLRKHGLVEVDDADFDKLALMQRLHDNWAESTYGDEMLHLALKVGFPIEDYAEVDEHTFMDYLNWLERSDSNAGH